MTWNIEGFSRSSFEIKQLIDSVSPELIFLSEPCLFQCDANLATNLLSHQYSFFLNSEDFYEPDLPLHTNRAHGGTMTLWKKSLDPFITVFQTQSSRILPIILDVPGLQTSAHINIYLPTAGRENEFVDELATLQNTIEDISEKYPAAIIYIRGDANACVSGRTNNKRDGIFKHFCDENFLENLHLNHKTYHHFMGDGKSDSSIDVILSSTVSCDGTPSPPSEHLLDILCRNQDTRIFNSHHDAIITQLALSHFDTPEEHTTDEIPTVVNSRHKIIWSDESLQEYSDLILPVLAQLREDWLVSSSPSCMSVLIQHTNNILTSAAKSTQKVIDLGLPIKPKRTKPSVEVSEAAMNLKKAHDKYKSFSANPTSSAQTIEVAKTAVASARSVLQKLKRKTKLQDELSRDANLHTVLSSGSKRLFSFIKSNKKSSVHINKLNVGDEVFTGENVGKGFFKSIKALKTKDTSLLECPTYNHFLDLHHHILDICRAGEKIPLLSFSTANDLLKSVKPSVTDFFSISALHYINGGDDGVLHFQLLLNAILSEIENFAISEMNKVSAIILHKGHGKDKNSDRSYRTISSCPFLAKCADKYIGNLTEPAWTAAKAETQFQSKGLSHEHAAILLTETVNHSLHVNKEPVFCLLLDAKSAFDRALREVLTTRMYLAGTSGHSLLYLDKRLECRETYVEWDKVIVGPIKDQQGIKQAP